MEDCDFSSNLVCVFNTLAVAQNRGSITGRVTDATDAVIPGVSIKVTNINTGATRETITNETGRLYNRSAAGGCVSNRS